MGKRKKWTYGYKLRGWRVYTSPDSKYFKYVKGKKVVYRKYWQSPPK